jgi:hypothetical protein
VVEVDHQRLVALLRGDHGERKGQCGFAVPALLPNDGYG